MGIALLTLSTLFEQLQSRPARRSTLPRSATASALPARVCTAGPVLDTAQSKNLMSAGSTTGACSASKVRPLRVLQVTESVSRPGSFGRLLMSGRMADVCAELERLTDLEERRTLH